ncbi:MAG: hypothetical protein Q9220_001703 [cf. Caloplaca sp. 1 TL-2023]
MASMVEWFQKIPRNTQESVQRLTLYGWLRLILIVAAYILIRPYLMKLAERSQTAAHDKAARSHSAVTPNMLRGHSKDTEKEQGEEASTSSWSWGPKARKRQKKASDGVVESEMAEALDEDEEEDAEFLKKFRDDHESKMSRPQDVYFDYNARQQYLRTRARAPSRPPKRRWPPSPCAEDELVSLSHEYKPGPPDVGGEQAGSRGSLDQQPLILDVYPLKSSSKHPSETNKNVKRRDSSAKGGPISSDDSDEISGPETPTDSSSDDDICNQDRRYVFIPQEGVEIPLTYDEPRTPILAKHSQAHSRPLTERGRRPAPKLDIKVPQADPTNGTPVRIERERSPYSSAPRSKNDQNSEGLLLSPEIASPTLLKGNVKTNSVVHEAYSSPQKVGEKTTEYNKENLQRPARPSMARHQSAMANPGQHAATVRSPTHVEQFTTFPSPSTPRSRNVRLEADIPTSPRRSSAIPLESPGMRLRPSEGHVRQSSVPPPRTSPATTYKPTIPSPTAHGFAGQQSLNAMLSSPMLDRRRASPRNSPRSSPQGSPCSSPVTSPPRTPPPEASSRKFSYMDSVRTSGSNSRPSSPLHHFPPTTPAEHPRDSRHLSETPRPTIRSRRTSPLPPPHMGYLDPDPGLRIDVRSPSPVRQHRSSTYAGEHERSRSQRPADLQSQEGPNFQTQNLKPSVLEQRRRSSSAVYDRPRLTVDSSRAQAATDFPQSRHLNLKSPTTRAASVGAPPPTLPPCPRSTPISGFNDWFTLVDYPTFKVCPTCHDAVSRAGHGRHFIANSSKSPERPVQCRFSIPWIRMAYLMIAKKRGSGAGLLYDMADVAEDTPPCPGRRPAPREWYHIGDIDTKRTVPGFHACPYCVRSLETMFPVLQGVFHKTRSRHPPEEATCRLRTDSSRFATCVDLLEDTAKQAKEYRRAPNMYRFVELAKIIGAIQPCSRDGMLAGKQWHIVPKLPEFTICSECYKDDVWPAVLQGYSLASKVSRSPQAVATSHSGVSCQMYSSRMRNTFMEACRDDDFEHLRRVALKRHRIEHDLQHRMIEAYELPRAQQELALEDILHEWNEWDE